MSSILTNNGAMVALQTLKGINSNLSKTQSEISTGKSIGTAKDNAAIWAIAKGMESEVGGLKSVSTSLSVGAQAISVAGEASETVTDLLKEVQKIVIQAQDGNIDKATLQKDIGVYRDQIASVVASSQFNGANLVNGSATSYSVLASMKGDTTDATLPGKIAVTLTDLSEAGALADLATLNVSTDAAGALESINTMIASATTASQQYGSAAKRVEIQTSFISKLSDAMTAGVGALVDTNMEEASARLQALQTQQQLGIQALSIANQAPQSILSLFR